MQLKLKAPARLDAWLVINQMKGNKTTGAILSILHQAKDRPSWLLIGLIVCVTLSSGPHFAI